MIKGLSNTKLENEMFLDLIKEFRGFIGGTETENNLATFLNSENELDKVFLNEYKANLKPMEVESNSQKVKDKIIMPLLDNTKSAYMIKDIVTGAAFSGIDPETSEIDLSETMLIYYENIKKNFLSSQVLAGDAPDWKEDETYVPGDSQVSIKRLVRPIEASYQKEFIDGFGLDPGLFTKKSKEKKEKDAENNEQPANEFIKGNFATPVWTPGQVFINGGSNPPGESSRKESPGLAAFVIRKPDIGITSRNADPINIFFNAITPLEMSRCTPFINLAVVTPQDETKPKKMNNVTFMRYTLPKGSNSFILDEGIGLQEARPYDIEGIRSALGGIGPGQNDGFDVSLMDIFTSTQVASNSDINTNNRSSNHVLEPISPFLTLNSLSVNVSGMGIALFSSKTASMELTLHDRSRLGDVSSLVAPNSFGLTKIIIEYGWSHPDGDYKEFNDNKVGRFLNRARDRGIFTVKSSNFNFSDGNTVKISLSLACYGSDETKSITAAAGSQVPLTVFKPTISKIMQDIVEKSRRGEAGISGGSSHREVRHLLRLSQRNTVSNTSLVTFDDYKDLIKAYDQSIKESGVDLNRDVFANALLNLVGPTDKHGKKQKLIPAGQTFSKEQLKERIDQAAFEDDKNATQLLYGKLYALTSKAPTIPKVPPPSRFEPESAGLGEGLGQHGLASNPAEQGSMSVQYNQAQSQTNLYKANRMKILAMQSISFDQSDPFKIGLVDFVANKAPATQGSSIRRIVEFMKQPDNSLQTLAAARSRETVSLGKIIMSFIGHSLSMSGLFDEIQVYFYPLNRNAGAARIHTTASLPINKKDFFQVVVKKLSQDPNLTINGMFNLIERKIIRDNQNFAYGLDAPEKVYAEDFKTFEKMKKEWEEKAKTEKAEFDVAQEEAKEEAGDNPGEESEAEKYKMSTELEEEEQRIINFKAKADDKRKRGIRSLCKEYYSSDGCPDPVEPVFIRPNLSMYMETVTGSTVADQHALATNSMTHEDRAKYEKAICRLHIYDLESISKPFAGFLNSMITEGASGDAFVAAAANSYGNAGSLRTTLHTMSFDKDGNAIPISEETNINTTAGRDALKRYLLSAPAKSIKEAIKRAYPSITYGASTGTIKSIKVSSTVSNNVSQVILVSSIARKGNPQGSSDVNGNFDEMEVVPSNITVEMMGCPFIQRGNQIYIDFGTATTLDNIYTVKTVSHSLQAGEFSTTVELIFAGQGRVSSIREKVFEAVDELLIPGENIVR